MLGPDRVGAVMKKRWGLIALILCWLAGCAEPVPMERRHYVGVWEGEAMVLVIRPDGMLNYARQRGSVNSSVDGPIKAFEGNDLVVGVGWFTTTFEVSTPPRLENGEWIMVVDGVRLTRVRTFNIPEPASEPEEGLQI